MNQKLMQGFRQACKIIDHQPFSADHFISRAVEWLARKGKVEIHYDDDTWNIKGEGFVSPDETLFAALVGAVFAQDCVDREDAIDIAGAAEARESGPARPFDELCQELGL